MIGQEKLINKLNKYTFSTLPSSIIIEGGFGCGKHLIVEQLCNQLEIKLIDISLLIDNDMILSLYTKAIPSIYLIDISKASSSKKVELLQNSILKLIEEPPELAKIIIICETKNYLLHTIQNRCLIYTFEKYSIDELQQYCVQEHIDIQDISLFNIYDTPGKLKLLISTNDFADIVSLTQNIILNIGKANVSNILTICDKIDFGSGGYNLYIFIQCMKLSLTQLLVNTSSFNLYKQMYLLTKQLSVDISWLGVDKKALFENYLLNLKSLYQ